MSVVLALGAAVVFGSADFMGGLVSRRVAPLAVALGSQLSGLVVLVAVLPFLGPATVTPADVAWGGIGGLFGGIGLVLLFRVLAKGPMSIVAPTTALSASTVPILAGIALGDRPGPIAIAGIGVALVAVLLITREHTDEHTTRIEPRVVVGALVSGVLFGFFFVALHQTGSDTGLWPLLAARAVSIPVLAALVVRKGVHLDWLAPGARRVILLSGALDMAANVLYLLALRHGMLAVVAAVAGLYPASTVLLARSHLDERLQRIQVVGLGVAACAAMLIAV